MNLLKMSKVGRSFVGFLIALALQASLNDAGCKEAKLCCFGQDDDCKDESEDCYCDSYCNSSSYYCCSDFQSFCGNRLNRGIKVFHRGFGR